jgi:hypothetical protein
MDNKISRRHFLSATAVAPVALAAATGSAMGGIRRPLPLNPDQGNWVRWLDGRDAPVPQGITWGTPWPRGAQRSARHFSLRAPDGRRHSLQSWPLAWWPDGSLKFTAHALPPQAGLGDGPFEVIPQRGETPAASITIRESDAAPRAPSSSVRCCVKDVRRCARVGWCFCARTAPRLAMPAR